MIKDVLFWEKFRPKNINQIILLPRIKKFLGDGFSTNVLMHGHMGTGKTSLARILLKDKNYKQINASLKNGVDVLREELEDFCTSMPSPFIRTDDKMKYVYLEEFDKATSAFQDAFKAFIEEYNSRVRFIITMNHVENATPEVRSRFNEIDFNPQNEEEKEFLKKGYAKYLKAICNYLEKNDEYKINENVIEPLISRNFPDLRSAVQDLQKIYLTKDDTIDIDKNYSFIFEYLLNGENDPEKNFDFVETYFADEPRNLLKALGKPFTKYIIDMDKETFKNKGFLIIKVAKEHNETYDNSMVDPIIHLTNYINEIKKILK
jgi:DNA polymerase III delta prime subunit